MIDWISAIACSFPVNICKYVLSNKKVACWTFLPGYESLNGNLRLVLSDHGFKQLSDPNTTIVYRGNLLFLTMGIMYLPCEYLLLTALVW